MFDASSLGKTLVLFGVLLIFFGGIFMLGGKLSWFGRLPGDVYLQKKNLSFYFPITTSIIISIILSVILVILRRR